MNVKWLGVEYEFIADSGKLLVAEMVLIEDHYRRDYDDLTQTQRVTGLVLVSLKRHVRKLDWPSVENLTFDELNDLLVLSEAEQAEYEARLEDGEGGRGNRPAPTGGAASTTPSVNGSSASASTSGGIPETSTV